MLSTLFGRRAFSTSTCGNGIRLAPEKDYGKAEFLRPHPPGGMKLWRGISLFVAVPTCVVLSVIVMVQHSKEHECYKQREYIEYDHLNIRNKRFPWGDGNHSFFHNKQKQWVPGVGFESDGEH